MRANVEPLEGNKVKLFVEVDEAEFEPAVDLAFRKLAREVRIPGFRPGKAPRRVLEARVGVGYARQEALREVLPTYYVQALRDADVDAIAQPEINITSGEESGAVAFEATVEVRPTITVEGYGGLKVTVPSLTVTDEDVEEALTQMRKGSAKLVDVDRPAEAGDVVTIDLKATQAHDDHEHTLDDVTDYTYEVGAGRFPAAVEEALVGVSAGDELELDARRDGAEEAEAGTEESHDDEGASAAEPPIHFAIRVKKVQEQQLPELTDEWVDENSEFDNVDELRADMRTRLAGVRRVQALMTLQEAIPAAVAELVDEEAPEALVGAEIEERARALDARLRRQGASLAQFLAGTGQTTEGLVDQLRADAVPAVKADLALRAIADAEGLEATDEDVEGRIQQLAAELGQPAELLREALDREDGLRAVRSGVRKAKALDWLMEHVEIVDAEGNPVDRALLDPPEPPGAAEDEAVDGAESSEEQH